MTTITLKPEHVFNNYYEQAVRLLAMHVLGRTIQKVGYHRAAFLATLISKTASVSAIPRLSVPFGHIDSRRVLGHGYPDQNPQRPLCHRLRPEMRMYDCHQTIGIQRLRKRQHPAPRDRSDGALGHYRRPTRQQRRTRCDLPVEP